MSCSNWEAGYFAAYRHPASHAGLDAVLHMGDYLYEYPTGEYRAADGAVRVSQPAHEIVTLADYRIRHGHYKTDPDLQGLHAAAPWITTRDDHESANDAWLNGAENHDSLTEGRWRDRAAASRRAYDEWMPIRLSGTSAIGDGNQIYRQLSFGTLADLRMLDLRSYRSEQAPETALGQVGDADRTITGTEQMTRLKSSLSESAATWKLVGNPVMISPVTFAAVDVEAGQALHEMGGLLPPEGIPYNVDQWDGYTADRRELIDHPADHAIDNTVFITGDIHSARACDVPKNVGTYPLSRSVAVEFVGTSVTSEQPRRHPQGGAADGVAERRGRHPHRQPARALPRLRPARLLGPHPHPRRGPDGLVRARRPDRPRFRGPMECRLRDPARHAAHPPRLVPRQLTPPERR
ncbi:alkaline phosphatase D family protein [Janibacter limosus]|uniref:Alkaline phosphatase D family protein n=1 Tax=Janibacter limosus TaxID=53458 RepID=A0AC61U198_9MICO|nr:alkaline phosphatase D family protein [Janibacter limosus]UUZ43754.1 alkaline phosphatase D family protein [Janibacter limosus]